MPNILITGSNGFIGKNFYLRIKQFSNFKIFTFNKKDNYKKLKNCLPNIDFIFHFAGTNRSDNKLDFKKNNIDLTKKLASDIKVIFKYSKKKVRIIYTSSIQASINSNYGKSKLSAEKILLDLEKLYSVEVYIMRLNNIFGKWSKPNYNSVVATFCHNISRNLPIKINDYHSKIKLTYIDDLIDFFLRFLEGKKIKKDKDRIVVFKKEYKYTVGKLANLIKKINNNRNLGVIGNTQNGLYRAIYATYLSYLEPKNFLYKLNKNTDIRGSFVEILKTTNSGQISFFTSKPGITRGCHYHNSKSEKFLVLQGKALFSFKSINNKKNYNIYSSDKKYVVIDTVPGWGHKIKNIGNKILIVLVWANEIFDQKKTDTFALKM